MESDILLEGNIVRCKYCKTYLFDIHKLSYHEAKMVDSGLITIYCNECPSVISKKHIDFDITPKYYWDVENQIWSSGE